jgi:hydrogenase maturation protease
MKTVKHTLVLGVGNTLVSDDGVGIQVLRELARRIQDPRLAFAETQSGGLDMLEQLIGYRSAVIIDAAKTGSVPPGALCKAALVDTSCPPSRVSLHTLGLQTVVPFGTMLGFLLPGDITVFGIEVADVETFHEGCTSDVEAAIPGVASEIVRFLQAKLPDMHTPGGSCMRASPGETVNHHTYQET